MQYITLVDFLLLPLYLFFLYFIIKITAKKYLGTPLHKYFITGFFLHMAGSIAYAMVIQFYYGYGDSFGFYKGSNFIRDLISNGGNPFTILFTSSEELLKPQNSILNQGLDLPIGISSNSNFIVMKLSALLSYISFNSYLIISLFFGLFAFAGLWRLFCTFNKLLGKRGEKILAYSILYTPSICFWGSGLMKDSLCLGLAGFIIYYVHKMFIEKKGGVLDFLFLIINFYLLFAIKSYIASILIVSAALTYVVLVFKKSKTNIIKLFVLGFVLLVSTVFLVISLSSTLNSLIEESKEQIEIFKGAYANADSEDDNSLAGFKPGDFELSVSSFIIRSPLAMFSTLFRPFLWESKKIVILFSALESLLMLLALFYVLVKVGFLKFFHSIFSQPYVFFAFILTLLLSAVVGFTTFNFGTLVRYRLPILPFYFFMLIGIYLKNKSADIPKRLK